MLDFPASPTNGQVFTSGAQSWTWDGTKWVASGNAVMPPLSTGDNRIINGDMRIDARNNGNSGTAQGYTADRWLYANSTAPTGRGTWTRIGPVTSTSPIAQAGFPYYFNFASSSAYTAAAGDTFSIHQRIEADMVSDFAWGTPNAQSVTLSFWAFSSLTGTFGGSVTNPAVRSYPFTFSLPVASTWTKIIVNIPADTGGTWALSGNAEGVRLNFDLGSGATFRGPAGAWASANYVGATGAVSVVGTNGANLAITGVKLEIGSVATPYPRQSLAKSLADCQRYYQVGQIAFQGYSVLSAGVYASQSFPVQMRANPTKAIVTNNCSNVGTPTWANLTPAGMGATLMGTTAATGAYALNVAYTMDAEL